MRIRDSRFATQCGVLLLSALAIYRATSLLGFVAADQWSSGEARSASLKAYFGSTGVASLARSAGYQGDANPSELELAKLRTSELSDLLATSPTDSAFWLSLARMRKIAGDTPVRVLSALSMSSITGPNEGSVMKVRAPFELSIWELLPADAKSAAAADLVAVGNSIPAVTLRVLRVNLLQKPDSVRQDMKAVLGRTYGMNPALSEALGL